MFDGTRLHMKVYGITWMNVLIPVELSLLKNVRWNSIAYESVWNHMDECASSRETVSMVKGQRRQGRALAHKALHPRDWAMNCLHGQ